MEEYGKQKLVIWTSGASFEGLLTIVFITLKLCGVIGWSWWWVLSPLWIPWALFGGLFVLGVVLAFIIIMSRGGRKEDDDDTNV